MKKIAIVVHKLKDNELRHVKLAIQRALQAQGLDFNIWLVQTRHRLEDFKREWPKARVK